MTEDIRIRNQKVAETYIGRICTYNTTDGTEYGLIKYATLSEIVLERMLKTDDGHFVPHPISICARSKNRVTFSRRIFLIAGKLLSKTEEDPVEYCDEIIDEMS